MAAQIMGDSFDRFPGAASELKGPLHPDPRALAAVRLYGMANAGGVPGEMSRCCPQ